MAIQGKYPDIGFSLEGAKPGFSRLKEFGAWPVLAGSAPVENQMRCAPIRRTLMGDSSLRMGGGERARRPEGHYAAGDRR